MRHALLVQSRWASPTISNMQTQWCQVGESLTQAKLHCFAWLTSAQRWPNLAPHDLHKNRILSCTLSRCRFRSEFRVNVLLHTWHLYPLPRWRFSCLFLPVLLRSRCPQMRHGYPDWLLLKRSSRKRHSIFGCSSSAQFCMLGMSIALREALATLMTGISLPLMDTFNMSLQCWSDGEQSLTDVTFVAFAQVQPFMSVPPKYGHQYATTKATWVGWRATFSYHTARLKKGKHGIE